MTATAPTAPALPAWVDRTRAVALSVALHPWSPVGVAVAATVMILILSATALVQTRLHEMAAGPDTSRAAAISTPTGAPTPVDFTLSPAAVRPISMDEARVWNAALPFSSLPILPARPFIMPPESVSDYARALDCLTAAVYYEAASESALGQAAVAQVVINRMRHPAFPKTVCGVVFQGQERTTGCQFSFTCDGALARRPSAAGWARARAAAAAALNGHVTPEVGMATHYHTDWVAPYWAERLVKMRQIDTHIFYRWTGAWGLPGAFTGAHAGVEPVIAKLSAVATHVEELGPVALEVEALPSLDLTPIVTLVRPEEARVAQGPAIVEEAVTTPPPVEMVAVPPAPPPILASPLDAPRGVTPQRRARIATPR